MTAQRNPQDTLEWNYKSSQNSIVGLSDTDLPRERYELLKAIDYLKSLEGSWSGYDAAKPSSLSLRSAKFFVERLPFNLVYPNKVSPDGDGSVVFYWTYSKERVLLTVSGTMFHLSHEVEGEQDMFLDDVLFDYETIPQAILSHIPKKAKIG